MHCVVWSDAMIRLMIRRVSAAQCLVGGDVWIGWILSVRQVVSNRSAVASSGISSSEFGRLSFCPSVSVGIGGSPLADHDDQNRVDVWPRRVRSFNMERPPGQGGRCTQAEGAALASGALQLGTVRYVERFSG